MQKQIKMLKQNAEAEVQKNVLWYAHHYYSLQLWRIQVCFNKVPRRKEVISDLREAS